MKIILLIFCLSCILNAQKSNITFALQKTEANCVIKLYSIKKFPCKNYGIITRDFQHEDTIIVSIREFVPPSPCRGPGDIAKDAVTITPPNKRFYIKLRFGTQSDKWRVFQSDTMYHVREEGKISFTDYVESKN